MYVIPGQNTAFEVISFGADGREGGDGADSATRHWPRLASYSSVFDTYDLATILGLPGTTSHDTPTADHALGVPITCWGDGRLHWPRATPQAIAMACEDLVGRHDIETLIRLRHDQPGLDSQQAVDRLNLPHAQQDQLRRRFTDVSRCHAIVVTTTHAGRRHTMMCVEARRADQTLTHHTFEQSWP